MIVNLAVQKKTRESEKDHLTVMRNQEAVVHEVGRELIKRNTIQTCGLGASHFCVCLFAIHVDFDNDKQIEIHSCWPA